MEGYAMKKHLSKIIFIMTMLLFCSSSHTAGTTGRVIITRLPLDKIADLVLKNLRTRNMSLPTIPPVILNEILPETSSSLADTVREALQDPQTWFISLSSAATAVAAWRFIKWYNNKD
jgi:hypothetical protein